MQSEQPPYLLLFIVYLLIYLFICLSVTWTIGVEALPLPQTEEEIALIHSDSPLPLELEESHIMFYLSLLGVAFVFAVNILKTEQSISSLSALGLWVRTRFSKEKTQ